MGDPGRLGHISAAPRLKTLSPSRLHDALSCAWSIVPLPEQAEPLPSGPEALLGSVLHELLRRATAGPMPDRICPEQAVRQVFEELLEQVHRELEAQGRRHLVPLRGALPYRMWVRRRQACFAEAEDILARRRPPTIPRKAGLDTRGVDSKPVALEELSDGRYVELRLEAPTLHLAGRLDVLERRGETFDVIDVKTGRVHDESGEVRESIAWQMRGYGLMVALTGPEEATIRLSVQGMAEETQWDFGATERERAHEHVAELSARLAGPGTPLEASTLANPGPSCLYCDKRHTCPAYVERAPGWWRDPPDSRIPADFWGEVRTVVERGELVELELEHDSGQAQRVVALSKTHFATPMGSLEGTRLALFGLYRHRSGVLYEMPSRPSNRRAWEAIVFEWRGDG